MRKKLQQQYTCLTLFKQDIKELVELFQTHLQDVVILIDGKRILDIGQLDQFDPAYQAQSLLARGFYRDGKRDQATTQNEHQSIELSMSKVLAILLSWKEADQAEPEILASIRKFLQHRVNRVHQALIFCTALSVLSAFAWSLSSAAQSHQFAFLAQLLLAIGGGAPLGLGTFWLFVTTVHLLRLDTRVFLFPGATEAMRTYGRRETIGTVGIALIFFLLVPLIVVLGFRLLWR